MNSRFINLLIILTRLLCQMQANSSGAEFTRTNIQVQEEKENFVITSSTKHEIRKFQVVRWQQRNVQKAYCTCKVVVLPTQPIGFFLHSHCRCHPHCLKHPIMHLSMLSPRVGGRAGRPKGIWHFNESQSQIPHPKEPTKCQFPASGVTFSNRVRT